MNQFDLRGFIGALSGQDPSKLCLRNVGASQATLDVHFRFVRPVETVCAFLSWAELSRSRGRRSIKLNKHVGMMHKRRRRVEGCGGQSQC